VARTRQVKPSFFVNEDMVELPFHTRLLFIGLLTIADRRGILEDRPKKIKMALFPADNLDVDQSLSELDRYNFIHRYEVDGAKYIHIVEFVKHQNPHRDEKPNDMPHPPYMNVAAIGQPSDQHDADTGQPSDQHDADTGQPSDQHDADTGQPSDQHDADTVAAQLVPCTLYPVPNNLSKDTHTNSDIVGPITAGQVCVELTRLGIMQVNPMHPELLAAIAAGATMQDFSFAATESVQKGKGFAYLVAIVKNRIQENRGNNAKNNNEACIGAGRKLSNAEQADRDIELLEGLDRARQERVIN